MFLAKPVMLTKSGMLAEAVDSTITIPCRASGIPEVEYSWYRNGKKISINEQGMQVHKDGLKIFRLKIDHEGFYQCVPRNRHGEVLMTTRLVVKSKSLE